MNPLEKQVQVDKQVQGLQELDSSNQQVNTEISNAAKKGAFNKEYFNPLSNEIDTPKKALDATICVLGTPAYLTVSILRAVTDTVVAKFQKTVEKYQHAKVDKKLVDLVKKFDNLGLHAEGFIGVADGVNKDTIAIFEGTKNANLEQKQKVLKDMTKALENHSKDYSYAKSPSDGSSSDDITFVELSISEEKEEPFLTDAEKEAILKAGQEKIARGDGALTEEETRKILLRTDQAGSESETSLTEERQEILQEGDQSKPESETEFWKEVDLKKEEVPIGQPVKRGTQWERREPTEKAQGRLIEEFKDLEKKDTDLTEAEMEQILEEGATQILKGMEELESEETVTEEKPPKRYDDLDADLEELERLLKKDAGTVKSEGKEEQVKAVKSDKREAELEQIEADLAKIEEETGWKEEVTKPETEKKEKVSYDDLSADWEEIIGDKKKVEPEQKDKKTEEKGI